MSLSKVINIREFVKKYSNGVEIKFSELNFSHKVTVLIGSNGSGKTTLLKALSKLIKHEGNISLTSKSMYVEEFPIHPDEMHVESYLNHLSVLGKRDNHLKERLLHHFFMGDKRNATFRNLSKGMKQKVNLIQAFMEDRDLYLLDEPFSGLDANSRCQLIVWIKESSSRFICATHDTLPFEMIEHQKIYL